MRGRAIPLSRSRKVVIDLVYFARKVPSLPVQRRMQLGAVATARQACSERPQWTAIFAKAMAIAAREMPVLRRAYVKLPWPQLYEFPVSTANIVFERDYRDEPCLFSLLVRDPAEMPLAQLRDVIGQGMTAPVESIKDFRRPLKLAALPRPLRRLIWSFALNVGRQRGNYFGTFGLSSYSSLNVDSLHPLSPLTTMLNYGYIDETGGVNVRLIYDHRVLDGATVARALKRLEEILNGPIVDELRAMG